MGRGSSFGAQFGYKSCDAPRSANGHAGCACDTGEGFYIFKDAVREARAIGNHDFGTFFDPLGRFFDPIGEPVNQRYSLYMWAKEQGKGIAFYGSFLKAAFNDGVKTTKPAGLQRAVEMAGLDWKEAQKQLYDDTWAETLEENRLAM